MLTKLIPVEFHKDLPTHDSVRLFSPSIAMYHVIRLECPTLPDPAKLLADHCRESDPRFPELWYDIIPLQIEGHKLVIKLHWYRDQKAEQQVNAQVFLIGEQHHRLIERISGRLYHRGISQQIVLYNQQNIA